MDQTSYPPFAATLGKEKTKALSVFHALAECDKLSIYEKRHKNIWEAWKVYPECSEAFPRVSFFIIEVIDTYLKETE